MNHMIRRIVFNVLIPIGISFLMLFAVLFAISKYIGDTPKDSVLGNHVNPALLGQLMPFIIKPHRVMHLRIHPYTGYHYLENVDEESEFPEFHYHYKTNNLGFLSDENIPNFENEIVKAPDERVVLLTGGSAAAGWGASANDKTIAAQLQLILNHDIPKFHWKVLNLAMGGWLSFQEFISVTLYGSQYHPDYIVDITGRNDLMVPTIYGEEVPNYYFFKGQKRLNEVFENLSDSSRWDRMIPFAQYRKLAKQLENVSKQPERIMTPEEIEKAVRFHMLAIEGISRQFPKTKILIATQPSTYFKDNALIKKGYEDIDARTTAMAKSQGKRFRYVDTQAFFMAHQKEYLVDDCHMNDAGQKAIAIQMAQIIKSGF